ncbi:type II toxin-antitoxin system VapC family toxin [Haoranjiania flava]|uniref:Type II toxin-antitoxin system VapC family toxin n=1 Tax=Haoranjiania flava TaxID=1856322 RepID=A0AAE3LJP9_9BACT|nr:type II toxin-antitoxin system VapC family toxin [Haoranjiania flava]MCU7693808.1 type II toxin-antitoxin system VapC family toxin [Haoranjiania flava]
MNGSKLLVDTNIILYLLNGNKAIAQILEGRDIYISFITEIELLSYSEFNEEEESIITGLLKSCKIVDINSQIKTATISIRKKNRLKLPDSIILATSQFLDIPFFTSDKRLKNIKGNIEILLYHI